MKTMRPILPQVRVKGAPASDLPPLLEPAFLDLVRAKDGIAVVSIVDKTPRRLLKPLAHHARRRQTVREEVFRALTETMAGMR